MLIYCFQLTVQNSLIGESLFATLIIFEKSAVLALYITFMYAFIENKPLPASGVIKYRMNPLNHVNIAQQQENVE